MIEEVLFAVCDEHLNAYQPRSETKKKAEKNEPIPVVFMPRKPHPQWFIDVLASNWNNQSVAFKA
jgi:hypothetical protein